MNTNAIHNVLNILGVVLAGVTAGLVYSGCTVLPTGAIECSQSFLDAKITGTLLFLIQPAKLIINIFRDGVGGLFKTQPPVQ